MGLFHKSNRYVPKHLTEQEETDFYAALRRTFGTTSKQLVWIFSINAVAWIWCSYVLAFMGKEEIAESLSSNICSVIIGELGLYLVTSTLESLFKYNEFGFTKHKKRELVSPTKKGKKEVTTEEEADSEDNLYDMSLDAPDDTVAPPDDL